jgi:hypothetical protein
LVHGLVDVFHFISSNFSLVIDVFERCISILDYHYNIEIMEIKGFIESAYTFVLFNN